MGSPKQVRINRSIEANLRMVIDVQVFADVDPAIEIDASRWRTMGIEGGIKQATCQVPRI
jgi:hypothetical protein